MSQNIPVEISLDKNRTKLKLKYKDDKTYVISSELLRVESPSAEVQGHGGPKKIVRNKQNVKINSIEEIGNYAIRIIFSDGHNSGYYTWESLYNFSQNHNNLMLKYKNSISSNR